MKTTTRHTSRALNLALGLCAAVGLAAAQTDAPTQTVRYEPSNKLFATPERGLSGMMGHTGYDRLVEPFGYYLDYFNSLRDAYGSSTVAISYYVGDWKYGDLPKSLLDRIQSDFDTARDNGFKVYPHFHYSYSFAWPPLGIESERDASKDVTIRHLQQLKPVFARNADVLLFLWAGMIGHYGEWWGSTNNNIGDYGVVNNNTREIIAAMLDATPPDRMMVMRYRKTKTTYFDDTTTLDGNTGWSGSDRARIGFENQCFMGDDRRTGTYQYGGSSGPWVYMNEEGKYVPQVGFPDPDCRDGRSTVQEMRSEMFASNWDLFGSAPHEILGLPANDPQELELIKQMGYHLRLETADLPTTASRGSEIGVTIKMANDGSGSLFNPRGVELILRHRVSGAIVVLPIAPDGKGNRSRLPGPQTIRTIAIAGTLDAAMPTGTYDLLLNLPDVAPSLRDRAAYSVRLANRDTWEADTGYNRLLASVEIR
jgi:Domain of unknown function (DUF4832)/Domain of unknown function (DUF4874)